jgi:hypothetical protein
VALAEQGVGLGGFGERAGLDGERDQLAGGGQREKLAPGIRADFGARVAPWSVTNQLDAGAGPVECGDRDDSARLGYHGQRHIDRLIGADRIDRGVDPCGSCLPHTVEQARAVGQRDGADFTQ